MCVSDRCLLFLSLCLFVVCCKQSLGTCRYRRALAWSGGGCVVVVIVVRQLL